MYQSTHVEKRPIHRINSLSYQSTLQHSSTKMNTNNCESSNSESTQHTNRTYKNKDIKLAKDCGIPIDIKLIIDLPTPEFNALLKQYGLSDKQMNTCIDIRKRGKNKSSAQNCRQKKINQQKELESRLENSKAKFYNLENTENNLICKKQQLITELNNIIDQYLNKNNADPNLYAIVKIGELMIIEPKMNEQEPVGSIRPHTLLADENNCECPFKHNYK